MSAVQLSCGTVFQGAKYVTRKLRIHRRMPGHVNCYEVRRWTYSPDRIGVEA